MGKGYAEGPAAEEAEAARERGDHLAVAAQAPVRRAVYGSTPDEPAQHFLGTSAMSILTTCLPPAPPGGSR